MNVGEVCSRKVISVEQRATLYDVASLMREHHIGSIIVVDKSDGQRMPLGLITDRDIVIEVIANQVEPSVLMAKDIVSTGLVSVNENDDLWDALKQMRYKGIRRTGVVDDFGVLVGVLSVDNIFEILIEPLQELVVLIGNEQFNETIMRPG